MLQAKEGETSCAEVYGFSLSFRQRFYSARPTEVFPLVKRSFCLVYHSFC